MKVFLCSNLFVLFYGTVPHAKKDSCSCVDKAIALQSRDMSSMSGGYTLKMEKVTRNFLKGENWEIVKLQGG